MDYRLAKILEGQIRLGGRLIMLESNDIPSPVQLYEILGFKVLERDYQQNELLQMIKIIDEETIIEPANANIRM
ncbi:hypothetical protein [Acetobacterium sp. KB-1]|uniref:hypothetical protein n=1 Tax=Acetobacterium sp. KB-1 TaxID=2184575 RepID=UPI0019550608|nr:hypothetical protein [Acetobacterium sp. KB-1]